MLANIGIPVLILLFLRNVLMKGLEEERPETSHHLTVKRIIGTALAVFALGALLGLIAKYADGSALGLIGSGLGFWIAAASLLAAWSRTPMAAGLHVLVFFSAMLSAYYLYSMILFGFFPKSQFIYWGSIALLSPVCGYTVWFARGAGWLAAFCAAMPISLLIGEGFSFIYTYSIPKGFVLLLAVFLWIVLPKNHFQRIRVIPLTAVILFVIEQLELLSILAG
ncbi:MAG: hypothetical protein ACQEXE_17510 [Bacillota bacterium]|uniref:hypothetical protein n=1 Tax=Cytobacillus TaxID=2675230 RepID=UPI001D145DF2|nr:MULTISPECIES: hypothetical protein [Cytobacillus]MCC3648911.1 hypothetical protein [Cytobacillus oceanisediminis]MCS0655260.1 hypothetical protein [Cytobacillus firmus]